jgi:diguanylate cyclase (GGDEF)-like protein/PAS domain S-box-containing protein
MRSNAPRARIRLGWLAAIGVMVAVMVTGLTAAAIQGLVHRSSNESNRAVAAQAALGWANELQAMEAKARAGDTMPASTFHNTAVGLSDAVMSAFGTSTNPEIRALVSRIGLFCDVAIHAASANPNVTHDMALMEMDPAGVRDFTGSIAALFAEVNGSLHRVADDSQQRADDAARKARVGAAGIAAAAIGALAVGVLLIGRKRRQLLIARGSELAESRFHTLVSRAPDLLVVLDEHGIVRYISPSAANLVGHACGSVTVGDLWQLLTETSRADLERVMHQIMAGATEASLVFDLVDAAGQRRHLDATITDHRHTSSVEGIVINARDVTESVALERRLAYEANHDALTGLGNRRSFEHKIHGALEDTAGRPDRHVALLIVDLDGFKGVNDSMGHHAGDELLRTFASRLRSLGRADETVVRLGGDEFAVIMEGVADIGEAQAAAMRLYRALWDPIPVGDELLSISACGGLVIADPDVATRDELLRRADLALYRAKRNARGTVVTYDQGCESDGLEIAFIQRELAKALDSGQSDAGHIDVAYQPVVRSSSGRIEACEVLARWHHPSKGVIAPDLFVAVAERSDLILALGSHVRELACAQMATWRRTLPAARHVMLSINVSVTELLDHRFLAGFMAVVSRNGLDPSDVTVELTEHRIDHRIGAIAAALERLRAVGFAVALDDFGASPTSLQQLQHLRVDTIKIDRALVAGVGEREQSNDLLEALLAFADQLDLCVVAEGVETIAQLQRLTRAGCDHLQGYVLSKPLAAESMANLLRAGSALLTPAMQAQSG